MIKTILTLIIAYLLGSISTGVVLSRIVTGKDIRGEGSGNIGTTNMLRVLGRKMALFTFIGDVLKGIVAVLIGKLIVGGEFGGLLGVAGSLLGHTYPVFFRFRGGKGIATGFGSLLFVFPLEAAAAFALFLLLTYLTHYVSLGSVAAALALPTFVMITHFDQPLLFILTYACGLFVVFNHRSNIKRLLTHTERKLDFNTLKKQKKDN